MSCLRFYRSIYSVSVDIQRQTTLIIKPSSIVFPLFVFVIDLFAVNRNAFGEGLLVLGTSLASAAAEDELGAQGPLLGHLPLGLDLLVDDGVVVLQVGAEALGLETGPQRELVHGRRVLGPDGEVLGVQGELALKVLDGVGVLEEEDLWGGRGVSGVTLCNWAVWGRGQWVN